MFDKIESKIEEVFFRLHNFSTTVKTFMLKIFKQYNQGININVKEG